MYAVKQIGPLAFRVTPTRDYTNRRPLGLDRALGKLRRRGCSTARLGISGHAEIRLPLSGEAWPEVTADDLARYINRQ